jgi:DNA repair exonuclease SbcCD ATPase subunit
MAVALEGLALDILDKGTEFSEEDVLEQLRLAGELGKALLEENQVLRQEANKLEDIVAELEQERENLTRTHLEELNAVRTTCNSENYELQQRLTELQSDETRRNELENEKNKRIFVLEDKVQSLEICIDQLKEERANQYWRGSDMGDNTLEALATWRSTEKELRSQITILTEEQSQHVDNIARLKEELSGMAGYVASLQAEISRSSSVLEQRDKEIVTLSQELEEMHQTLFDLQDEIESGQATVTPPLSSTGESVHEELMRVEEMAVADSFCLSPIAPFESFEQCER